MWACMSVNVWMQPIHMILRLSAVFNLRSFGSSVLRSHKYTHITLFIANTLHADFKHTQYAYVYAFLSKLFILKIYICQLTASLAH